MWVINPPLPEKNAQIETFSPDCMSAVQMFLQSHKSIDCPSSVFPLFVPPLKNACNTSALSRFHVEKIKVPSKELSAKGLLQLTSTR